MHNQLISTLIDVRSLRPEEKFHWQLFSKNEVDIDTTLSWLPICTLWSVVASYPHTIRYK